MHGGMSTPLIFDSRPKMGHRWLGGLPRGLLLAAVGLWAWYLAARVRTEQVGFSSAGLAVELGMVTLLAGPVAWLPFLGWRLRRVMLGTVGLLLSAVVLAELYGAVEEALVRRQFGAEPSQRLAMDRAWPFRGNGIVYEPGRGWSAHE